MGHQYGLGVLDRLAGDLGGVQLDDHLRGVPRRGHILDTVWAQLQLAGISQDEGIYAAQGSIDALIRAPANSSNLTKGTATAYQRVNSCCQGKVSGRAPMRASQEAESSNPASIAVFGCATAANTPARRSTPSRSTERPARASSPMSSGGLFSVSRSRSNTQAARHRLLGDGPPRLMV